MSELWLPGTSGPVDELVQRIHLRIEGFAAEHAAAPRVEVELHGGSTVTVRTISADPGFGFVTLCPYTDDGAEELIVPVGALARIRLRPAEDEEPFGFSLPER